MIETNDEPKIYELNTEQETSPRRIDKTDATNAEQETETQSIDRTDEPKIEQKTEIQMIGMNGDHDTRQETEIQMKDNNNFHLPKNKDIHMHNFKRILRLPQIKAMTGLSKGTIYSRIAEGLFPSQVSLGGSKAVGWVSTEAERIFDAYVAGLTKEQLRALVKEIESARTSTAPADNNDEPASETEGL